MEASVVLIPTWYIADFMSGDMVDVLPLHGVRLSSGVIPGSFSASLDLRKTGLSKAGARALLADLSHGKRTLVPVQEGVSTGTDSPPSSRALGEWWISKITASYRDPVVVLSGPEFAGYADHKLVTVTRSGDRDPVEQARYILGDLFLNGQTVQLDRRDWTSTVRIKMDVRAYTQSVGAALNDIGANGGAPVGFEWLIGVDLALTGWSPTKVRRTLEMAQPTIRFQRPDILLEVTAPGLPGASLTDAQWVRDEEAAASTVYGWGAGHGKDQIGPAYTSRSREPGEPVKSRVISDMGAKNMQSLIFATNRAMETYTPERRELTARLLATRFTPRAGEVYEWRADESWTRPPENGQVRCTGWSWSSSDPEFYDLDLERE